MSTYRNQSGQFVSAIQAAEEQHAEIFYMSASEFRNALEAQDGTWMEARMVDQDGITDESTPEEIEAEAKNLEGWFVWCCLPGCLPEGEADGPYKTAREAAIAYLD